MDIVTARTVSSITPTMQQLFKPMFDSLKSELKKSKAKASAEKIEIIEIRCGVMEETLKCLSEKNLLPPSIFREYQKKTYESPPPQPFNVAMLTVNLHMGAD